MFEVNFKAERPSFQSVVHDLDHSSYQNRIRIVCYTYHKLFLVGFSMKWMEFPRRKTQSCDVTPRDPNGWPGNPLTSSYCGIWPQNLKESPLILWLDVSRWQQYVIGLQSFREITFCGLMVKSLNTSLNQKLLEKPSMLSFRDEMRKHLLECLIVGTVPLENKNELILNRMQQELRKI